MRLHIPGWERILALSCSTCGVPIYPSSLPESLRIKCVELDRFGLGLDGLPLLEPTGAAPADPSEEDEEAYPSIQP